MPLTDHEIQGNPWCGLWALRVAHNTSCHRAIVNSTVTEYQLSRVSPWVSGASAYTNKDLQNYQLARPLGLACIIKDDLVCSTASHPSFVLEFFSINSQVKQRKQSPLTTHNSLFLSITFLRHQSQWRSHRGTRRCGCNSSDIIQSPENNNVQRRFGCLSSLIRRTIRRRRNH